MGELGSPLTSEQQRLRSDALQLARAWAPRRVELRRHTLAHGAHHPDFWRDCCNAGVMGVLVPAELGGSDQGVLAAVLVVEALAEGGTPTPFPVLTHALTRAVLHSGSRSAQQRLLPEVAAGRCLFGLAFTEADAGHNFFAMRTAVRRHGRRWAVTGTKTYISGVELADQLFVVGRHLLEGDADRQQGFTGVLVDPHAAGLTVRELDMGGREGVRQWQVDLVDVDVDPNNVLGADGAALSYLFEVFNLERLLYSALMLGLASYWLEQAVTFARTRTVFGDQHLYGYQAVAHPLARLHARLHAGRLALYQAAGLFDVDAAQAGGAVNTAKLLAAEVAHDVTDQALQVFGGRGFDRTLGLVDDLLDTRLFRSAPVSQELTLNFLTQHVLGAAGEQDGSAGPAQ